MKQDINNIKLNRYSASGLWCVEISSNEHGYNFIDLGHGRSPKTAYFATKKRLAGILNAITKLEEQVK